MDTKIADSNRMIAEFDGWTYYEAKNSASAHFERERDWRSVKDMAYDWDWNLLMPVVEKIEAETGLAVVISGKLVNIAKGTFAFTTTAKTKLLAVYQAVVAFVNWHNQQTKDNASK